MVEKQKIINYKNGLQLRYPKSNPNGHPSYYLNGKRIPSVTTVISGNLGWNTRMLMGWQAKLFRSGQDPDKIVGDACDIGTLTHDFIEHHIYGVDEYDIGDIDMRFVTTAKRGLDAYIEWETTNGVTYLESELPMGSVELGVAGTADAIGLVNGKVTLIDFKTSRSVYAEHIIQLAAYKAMIEETTDYVIEQSMVVQISKDDDAEKRISIYKIDEDQMEEGFNSFVELRALHERHKGFEKYLRQLKKKV